MDLIMSACSATRRLECPVHTAVLPGRGSSTGAEPAWTFQMRRSVASALREAPPFGADIRSAALAGLESDFELARTVVSWLDGPTAGTE